MKSLVHAENLYKSYAAQGALPPAVAGVSLSIARGQTLGLVGESGCGKTTLGRVLLRLYEPDAGRILFDGAVFFDDALARQPDAARSRRRMQMIFQDPGASLDPRKNARQAIAQALEIHRLFPNKRERLARVSQLLALVGLGPNKLESYPHELSGGERQRVAIARALATEPDFLVCDEPVTSLDLSIQAQILRVLQELQAQMQLSYLFIGHDLSVVRQVSDRIAVMFQGKFVEEAEADELILRPLHPYTRALLAAIPNPDPARRMAPPELQPAQTAPAPGGCPYAPQCPLCRDACRREAPPLRDVGGGHLLACFSP